MSKPYVTHAGYELLHAELTYLWEVRRPEVTQKVAWAASLGDRSENADYQYNKRLLAQLDRRIRHLRRLLATLQIIEFSQQQAGRVFFGAYVEIEADDNDELLQLRLVGSAEILGRSNYISVDSPMARALLGKAEGDEAQVTAPGGARLWYIRRIAYQCPPWFAEQEPRLSEQHLSEQPAADGELIDDQEARAIEQAYLRSLLK